MNRYQLGRWIFLALSVVILCPETARAQERAELAKIAIDLAQKQCGQYTRQERQVGLGGAASYMAQKFGANFAGKYTIEDVYVMARQLSGPEALQLDDRVRSCMLTKVTELMLAIEPRKGKVVFIMDSPVHPYRPDLRKMSESNADDIWVTLVGLKVSNNGVPLPLQTLKESVGPKWDRGSQVIAAAPSVVIIHFSAFEYARDELPKDSAEAAACSVDRPVTDHCNAAFLRFASQVISEGIPMIIYSRTPGFCSEKTKNILTKRLKDAIGGQPAKQLGGVVLIDMSAVKQKPPKPNISLDFQNDFARKNLETAVRAAVDADFKFQPSERVCVIGL
jgi:hypothetical protein